MNGDAASVPSQVHLALGKTAGTMTVAWTTMNATGSAAVSGVRYGPTTAADNIVNANDNNGGGFGAALPAYVAGDTRLLNVSGTRYTHVATMDGLVPGRAYTYQVDGDSTTFNFTFRRQGGAGDAACAGVQHAAATLSVPGASAAPLCVVCLSLYAPTRRSTRVPAA